MWRAEVRGQKFFHLFAILLFFSADISAASGQNSRCLQQILAAASRGIDFENSVGIHGTGLASIASALGTGYIPAGQGTEPSLFYIFPNLNHRSVSRREGKDFQTHGFSVSHEDQAATPVEAVMPYSSMASIPYYLLLELKLEITSENYRAAVVFATDPTNGKRSLMTVSNCTSREITEALTRAQRKSEGEGFAISFTPSTLRRYRLHNTGSANVGLYFQVEGRGIPIRYIHGIEAIGPDGRRFLSNLERGPVPLVEGRSRTAEDRVLDLVNRRDWEILYEFLSERNSHEERARLIKFISQRFGERAILIFVDSLYDSYDSEKIQFFSDYPQTLSALRQVGYTDEDD